MGRVHGRRIFFFFNNWAFCIKLFLCMGYSSLFSFFIKPYLKDSQWQSCDVGCEWGTKTCSEGGCALCVLCVVGGKLVIQLNRDFVRSAA